MSSGRAARKSGSGSASRSRVSTLAGSAMKTSLSLNLLGWSIASSDKFVFPRSTSNPLTDCFARRYSEPILQYDDALSYQKTYVEDTLILHICPLSDNFSA